MKFTEIKTQGERNFSSVSTQARLLVSESRHRERNRSQSMLHRVASELGIVAEI